MGGLVQCWPAALAQPRADCLAAVAAARVAVAQALPGDGAVALGLAGAACADCLRLVMAAAEYRPASGRWAPRLVALRDLVGEHAAYGRQLATAGRAAGGASAALLADLLATLADLQYYLAALGATHGAALLVAGDK